MRKPRFLSLFLASGLAVQANAGEPDLFELDLDSLTRVTIGSSNLHEESQLWVPASASVLTRAQLRHLGARTLDQVLAFIPGFETYRSSDESQGQPTSIRGLRSGNSSPEILLLIDGKRLNTPRTGGMVEVLSKIPLEFADKIEFIRGPASAIYGSNAFTGIINIVSATDINQAEAYIGEKQLKGGVLHHSRDLGAGKLSLFAKYEDFGGFHYDNVLDVNNQQIGSTRDPIQHQNLRLAWQSENWQLNWFYSGLVADDYLLFERIANGWNQSKYDFHQLSATWQKQVLNNWRSELSLRYQYNDSSARIQSSGDNVLPGGLADPLSTAPLLSEGVIAGSDYEINWVNQHQFEGDVELSWGLDLRASEVDEAYADSNYDLAQIVNGDFPVASSGTDLSFRTPIILDNTQEQSALFVQLRGWLARDLSYNLGARNDRIHSVDTATTTRGALVWRFTPNNSFKLLYGEAFRAPSINELGLTNNTLFERNPELQSEFISTWELQWVYSGDNIRAQFGGYSSRVEDAIVTRDNALSGRSSWANSTNVEEFSGLEAQLELSLNRDWSIRANYSYMFELLNEPQRQANVLAGLILNYHHGGWNWNLNASYQGNKEFLDVNDQLQRVKHHTLLATRLSWWAAPKWQYYLNVQNLLDDDHRTLSSAGNHLNGVEQQGRLASLGFVYRY